MDLSSNQLSEKGILALPRGLKYNQNLVSLVARHNNFKTNSRILATIGDLVVYHNKTVKMIDLLNVRASKYFENPVDQEEEDDKMVMFHPGQ